MSAAGGASAASSATDSGASATASGAGATPPPRREPPRRRPRERVPRSTTGGGGCLGHGGCLLDGLGAGRPRLRRPRRVACLGGRAPPPRRVPRAVGWRFGCGLGGDGLVCDGNRRDGLRGRRVPRWRRWPPGPARSRPAALRSRWSSLLSWIRPLRITKRRPSYIPAPSLERGGWIVGDLGPRSAPRRAEGLMGSSTIRARGAGRV